MLWLTGWKSRDSVPALVKEYLAGQLKVDEFVTHTLPVTKINDAFDLMHHGQRSVLTASIVLLISASYELSEWVEFWHPTRHMIGHFRGESHGHQAVICTGTANQTTAKANETQNSTSNSSARTNWSYRIFPHISRKILAVFRPQSRSVDLYAGLKICRRPSPR